MESLKRSTKCCLRREEEAAGFVYGLREADRSMLTMTIGKKKYLGSEPVCAGCCVGVVTRAFKNSEIIQQASKEPLNT